MVRCGWPGRKVTSTFSIAGIATGTLMVIIGYHAVRPFARRPPDELQTLGGTYGGGAVIGKVATPDGEVLASGTDEQPQARVTGQPVAAEDGAVRSPDEDTGGNPS